MEDSQKTSSEDVPAKDNVLEERGESAEEKTLSQFLKESEQEEKLQRQLLENSKFYYRIRNLEHINRCRYEDGYVYQQVYACITCYQEQIRALPDKERLIIEAGLPNNGELVKYLKPHGFCIGCMYNCHEGHDVIELYSKLDFRCDCGNGRMPQACKLFNEKLDYENL